MPASQTLTLSATGDSFVARRLKAGDPDAAAIAGLIGEDDVRISNLEVVVREQEGFPSAQSGGTWATTSPASLEDLKSYAFNVLTWANNHTLDYSYGGLEATAKYLNQSGWAHAGAGQDLPEASAPCYLETKAGRVACLAVTSSFHESWIAGNPRPGVSGRPGVNPLRFGTIYRVSPQQLEELKAVAQASGINAAHDLHVKEGFGRPDPEGTVRLGSNLFRAVEEGESEGEFTYAHPADLERMEKAIAEAGSQADWVLVTVHSHEMKSGRKDLSADFFVQYARACIDAGAHAVIGHGPHILRGIEIYKQRPIFHSLGNFIFQNESVAYLPADFYEKYGIDLEAGTDEALDIRTQNGRIGLGVNPKVWHSVIARWSMRDGVLDHLELHPVTLGFGLPRDQIGWPRLTDNTEPLREIAELSRPLGVEFVVKEGVATWLRS